MLWYTKTCESSCMIVYASDNSEFQNAAEVFSRLGIIISLNQTTTLVIWDSIAIMCSYLLTFFSVWKYLTTSLYCQTSFINWLIEYGPSMASSCKLWMRRDILENVNSSTGIITAKSRSLIKGNAGITLGYDAFEISTIYVLPINVIKAHISWLSDSLNSRRFVHAYVIYCSVFFFWK